MNKELWENVTDLIDEELTDEAAEYFAKHGTAVPSKADEDYGEAVTPVKLVPSPKKRGIKPFIAVVAAAAAVVLCVFTGKLLFDDSPIDPVTDPTVETSESSETAETGETSDPVDEEEISRKIAELFIETLTNSAESSMLDMMYVQAERLSEDRRLVAITVLSDSSYYTLVYEANGNDVKRVAHLFNTNTVEFFEKGDEILVHTIYADSNYIDLDLAPEYPDYSDLPQNEYTVPDDGNRNLLGHDTSGASRLGSVYYDEHYFILADGQNTNLGTVRRHELGGDTNRVFIGGVETDGSYGEYVEVEYADYIAEKMRLTEGWNFVMGEDFDVADAFSTESDHFRVIGNVDTAAGYILEAFGLEDTVTPDGGDTLDINKMAAIAIAEDYLPQHHRNHTDATGDTMYVMAARQSSDCALVLMTIPQNDETEYNTVVYTVNGSDVEWVDLHMRSNHLELYTNEKGILYRSLYIYEDIATGYRSYEENFYTLINGEYTCIAELMHADDNGEMKDVYIADFSIDTSEGDSNRVERTYDEYLSELERITEGWTLADSIELPADSSDAEGFQRIGDKDIVSGYILDALRKNDVSGDAVTVPTAWEELSREAAELFLEINTADGEDMLVQAAQAGDKYYAVTLVPHVLRYDVHIFEIDSEVSLTQNNALSSAVADSFEFYTKDGEILIHYSNWLYSPLSKETEYFDYYYTVTDGNIRLLSAVKRIENEDGDIVSYHIHDETLPTTNGLGYADVSSSEYAAETAKLIDGWELSKGVTLPHDGSVTEDFKPILDADTVAGYFLAAFEDSGMSSGNEAAIPTTLSAVTDEEAYRAVARMFLQQEPQADKLMVFGNHDDGHIGIAYKEGEYYTLHLFARGNGIVSYVDTVKDVTEFSAFPNDVVHYKVRTVLDGTDTVLNIYKKLNYVAEGGEEACYVADSYGITKKLIDDSNHVIGYYITDGSDLNSEFRSVNISEYNAMMQQTYQSNEVRFIPDVDFADVLYTFDMTQDENRIAQYLGDYFYYVTHGNPGSTKPVDYPDDPCIHIDGETIELERYAYHWHQNEASLDPYSMADNVPLEGYDTVMISIFGSGELIEAVCFDNDDKLNLRYSDVTGSNADTERVYELVLPIDKADKVYSITVEYDYGLLSYCFRISDKPNSTDEPGGELSSDDFMRFGSGMYSPSMVSDICIFDENGEMQIADGSYSFTDLDQLEYIGEYEQGSFYRINEYRLISVQPLGSIAFDSWYDWSFGEKLSEKYPREWCYQVRYWDMLGEYSGIGEYVFQPPTLTLTDFNGNEYIITAGGEYDDVKLPAGVMLLTTKYGGHAESALGKGVHYSDVKDSVILFNSDEEYHAVIWVTYGDVHSYTYSFTVTPLEEDVLDQPPMLKMLVDGKEWILSRGSYSWLDINGNKMNGEAIPKTPLIVQYGSELQVQLENGAEIIYVTSLYNVDGEYVSNPHDYAKHDVDGTLHISPDRIGSIIEIAVRFPQGTCHYHFALVDETGAQEEEFIAQMMSFVDTCSTIPDLKLQMKLHDVAGWLEDVQVYNDHTDRMNNKELTDGVLKAGMVIRVVYNGGKEWISSIAI